MTSATITLHSFGLVPEEEDQHVFTFIFENPRKLLEATKAVESSEVTHGGHTWSIVCMRKEERYMGIFLKWRYTDGKSMSSMSCRVRYNLTLIHRSDYTLNRCFTSTQKFSSSQNMLGKSKFIPISELLDPSSEYLDETGKRVALEMTLTKCTSRYEKTVDTSPKVRTRKNASGYYFDTSPFLLSGNRWYLRVYPTKANANGLPAVYLYITSKPNGITLEVSFRLYIGEDTTEGLTYHFGEGARFDGFGKTLPEPIYNVEKAKEITIGVEINSIVISKDVALNFRQQAVYSPHLYKDYNRFNSGLYTSGTYGGLTPADAFQDQEGNYWKADLDREAVKVTVVFDKGVHHYQQNKTKLLCWSGTLLSRNPNVAKDLPSCGHPVVGFFSNFIEDKGYLMCFPLDMVELEERGNSYTDEHGGLLVRIKFMSLQTIPLPMRSVPRLDFQAKHLLKARRVLQEKQKNLEDMRDMAASRASLSFLDTSCRDERLISDSSASSGGKLHLYKSYDSLDNLETGDMMCGIQDESGKSFFSDVLQHIAQHAESGDVGPAPDSDVTTSRTAYVGTMEDLSTESGVTVSDETSLLLEARPSPVDMGKQRELVSVIVKFLQQRLPFRISDVLEFGSLGAGTTTRSRLDVDIILFSPDLPQHGHKYWMPALLHALKNYLQCACANPDPFFPLPKCSCFATTPYALQFDCGGVDIDVIVTHDWNAEQDGYGALYEASCKQTTSNGRIWCAASSARLQKKFVCDQPNEVKELVKVVKHWRNTIHWRKATYRPNSYLLSLLVIKAVDETRSFDMKTILVKVGAFVMAPELSLSWSMYYLSEKYPVDFDPPTPLVRDPANPGFNVAETLPYWGQFRTEYQQWLKSLSL